MVSTLKSFRRGVRRWSVLTSWRQPHTERRLIEQRGGLTDTVLGRFDPARHLDLELELDLEPFQYIAIADALSQNVYKNLTETHPSSEEIYPRFGRLDDPAEALGSV